MRVSDKYNLFNLVKEIAPEKSSEILDFLIDYGRNRKFQRGEIMITENDKSDFIFILLDGVVEVVKKDENSQDVVLTELGKGAIVGEMGVFLDKKRTATIRAKTDIIASKFTNYSFLQALTQMPDLLLRLLKSFSSKINYINYKLMSTIETKIILAINVYITEYLYTNSSTDINLHILTMSRETGLEKEKIFTALETLKKHSILENFKVNIEDHVSFSIKPSTYFKYIKTISYT